MSSADVQAPEGNERVGAHTAVRDLLVVAAPTIATMTSYTLMQFVDKLLVSRIGPDPVYVGAQGNGGLAAFVPIAIAMGFLTVVNTYVAQNLGAGKPERAPAYAWAGLWIALVFWIVALLPLALLLPSLFSLLFRDSSLSADELAEALRRDDLSAQYGRMLLYGAFLTMATRGIAQYFYGMHRAGVVLCASIAGNLTNLFLNSLLVFGPTILANNHGTTGSALPMLDAGLHVLNGITASVADSLGIEAMGIRGSAIATVIGTGVEFMSPFLLFISPKWHRMYRTRDSWRPSWPHIRDLLKTGWAQGLMFGNEMICWAFFMVFLVGRFGPVHSTAGWIAHQWMSLSFMPSVGLSIAVTAAVGKCLGAKRADLAARRAWTGLGLALAYMGTCGVLFVVFGRQMIELFIEHQTPEADRAVLVGLGVKFLYATAAFQLFDAIAMTLSGALRGAGDTVWTGIATLVCSWTLIVGGGIALVEFAPGLKSVGPWIAAASYIIVLALLILFRFLAGKWKTMALLEHSAASGH
jgi:MATE family multidrug resistance protein